MNIEPKSHIHMEKILPLFLAAAALLAQAAVGQNATCLLYTSDAADE